MMHGRAFLALFAASVAASALEQVPLLGPENKADQRKDEPAGAEALDLDHWTRLAASEDRKLCVIEPSEDGGDDGPVIAKALNEDCRTKSLVVLAGPTYNINSTMTTMHLDDVQIHQFGRLLWTPEIEWWRSQSMPINFQNQSTVWYFGGDGVVWDGHGVGTLDGNGQVWYDWAHGRGNLPRRPMNINYVGFNNSQVRNLRYVQSQMWTMAITYSHNLEFSDIYVNNTSNSTHNTLNTDGVDTVYSDNITFRRWTVVNGDDAVALKGNSSNIFVYDSVFHDGQGIAIGSMGQYDGRFEYIENFYARNITFHNTAHVSYLKTWSGHSNGWPPNGGGGGKGYARNIVIEDVVWNDGRHQPFFSWQCEHYEGDSGKDCNSSEFKMSDVAWRNVKGTAKPNVIHAGWFQCSAAAGGCTNVTVEGYDITFKETGEPLGLWHCENVFEYEGFTCNH